MAHISLPIRSSLSEIRWDGDPRYPFIQRMSWVRTQSLPADLIHVGEDRSGFERPYGKFSPP